LWDAKTLGFIDYSNPCKSRKFFTPSQPSPRHRGGSKKFTNDLGLLYPALHHPLIDLGNRLLFNTKLSLEIALNQQLGSFLAVLFLDLDRFKLTSCTILKNRQDACSTRKFTLCGTGILPVHKKLIENGATSQFKTINGT
jgi:hypothetical protein